LRAQPDQVGPSMSPPYMVGLGPRVRRPNPHGWVEPILEIRACLASQSFTKWKNAFCVLKALPNTTLR